MELPIIPLLIGGVVIMSIISWAEDHLKDKKKKTLKHWNKESPLRQAFKTVVNFQYDMDISDSENNKKLRNFHRNAQTVAKTMLKTKYKSKFKPKLDNAYNKLLQDTVGVKDKTEMFNDYVAKVNDLLPDEASSPSYRTKAKPSRTTAKPSRTRTKPQGILKNKPRGLPKNSISEDSVSANSISANSISANSVSANSVSENSVSAPAPVRKVSFGSKRRKHKRSKKRSNKKSKKRSNKKSKKIKR